MNVTLPLLELPTESVDQILRYTFGKGERIRVTARRSLYGFQRVDHDLHQINESQRAAAISICSFHHDAEYTSYRR